MKKILIICGILLLAGAGIYYYLKHKKLTDFEPLIKEKIAQLVKEGSEGLYALSIGKIDIDSEQKTASRFQITSVPTMILFKDGKEVGRLVGLRNADAVKKFIESAL